LVHYYEKLYKDIIMIKPSFEVKNKGINVYSLFAVCYPFSNEYSDPNTYNYAKWDTVMTSNGIFILKN